jgi:hypothetical protein
MLATSVWAGTAPPDATADVDVVDETGGGTGVVDVVEVDGEVTAASLPAAAGAAR